MDIFDCRDAPIMEIYIGDDEAVDTVIPIDMRKPRYTPYGEHQSNLETDSGESSGGVGLGSEQESAPREGREAHFARDFDGLTCQAGGWERC